MKHSKGVKIYCKTLGKVFEVNHIAKTIEETNQFMSVYEGSLIATGKVFVIAFNQSISSGKLPQSTTYLKLSNDLELYCKSMGRLFFVTYIASGTEAATLFHKKHTNNVLVAVDSNDLHYFAEQFSGVDHETLEN